MTATSSGTRNPASPSARKALIAITSDAATMPSTGGCSPRKARIASWDACVVRCPGSSSPSPSPAYASASMRSRVALAIIELPDNDRETVETDTPANRASSRRLEALVGFMFARWFHKCVGQALWPAHCSANSDYSNQPLLDANLQTSVSVLMNCVNSALSRLPCGARPRRAPCPPALRRDRDDKHPARSAYRRTSPRTARRNRTTSAAGA